MNKMDKIVATAITSLFTLTTGAVISTTAYAAQNDSHSQPNMEKCYGIAKAQMNDCKTDHASCAGSATQNNQPDAFLFTPAGLCDKIVGGKLKPEGKK